MFLLIVNDVFFQTGTLENGRNFKIADPSFIADEAGPGKIPIVNVCLSLILPVHS